MSGSHSRRKGQAGERELAGELRRMGIEAYRGRQYHGANEAPDVKAEIPDVHIEVKRTESLSLYTAMSQAISDCGEDIPIVAHRRNKKPWLVIVHLDDLPALAEAVLKALK